MKCTLTADVNRSCLINFGINCFQRFGIIRLGAALAVLLVVRAEVFSQTYNFNDVHYTKKKGLKSQFTEPLSFAEDENSATRIIGLFVANFGDEAAIAPNIVVSRDWKIGENFGFEARLMAFQENKDTTRYINSVNLIKPEISNYNLRLAGDWRLIKNVRKLGFGFEVNLYNQDVNKKTNSSGDIFNGNITSVLAKAGLLYEVADGLSFLASGQYVSTFTGIEDYENTFGTSAPTNLINFELSGKFQFKVQGADGIFIQPVFYFNTSDSKELIGTKDPIVFTIRVGVDKKL